MLPRSLSPMLATPGAVPTGDGWAHEVKWDGVRVIAAVEGSAVRLVSRAGNDVTDGYPELAGMRTARPALLDGELVVLGPGGRPDFGRLQSRMHVRGPAPALVAATPVTLVVFDLLHLADRSLLDETYDARRDALSSLTVEGGSVQVPEAFLGEGASLAQATRESGVEGVVSKRRDSRYLPGRRSDAWVKAKHALQQSVVVCGWKPGVGGRAGRIGSLLVGVHGPDGLAYAGHVGTGFSAQALALLQERLAALERRDPPYTSVLAPVPREHARAARWVEPVLVGDVQLTAWTRDGRLRHPSWKGLRDDLDPEQVVRE